MTKSRKRMLLSSIAMLLVALVALGSATYAWFTVSKTVTADGMQVKAIASAGLEISNTGASGTYDTTVSFGQTTDSTSFQLKPVSWNGTTATGFIPAANVEDEDTGAYSGAFKEGASSSPTADNEGEAKGSNINFAIYKVWVRSAKTNTGDTYTTSDAHTVKAKVTISGDNAAFARVKFVDVADDALEANNANKKNSTKIYADTAANDNNVVAAVGTTKTTYTTYAHNVLGSVTGTDANAAQGKEFDIIVWFDGEDGDCKNTARNKTASIVLTFEADDM